MVFTESGPYDTIFALTRLPAIAVVVIITFLSGAVRAGPGEPDKKPVERKQLSNADKAQKLAQIGMKRANARDYQGALVMFKRALALDNRGDIQCNVGAAYYWLKRWPEAHLYLGICLSRPANPKDAALVTIRKSAYAATEKKLREGEFAPVKFDVTPATARIRVSALPGDVTFTAPRKVWLPTGSHRVDAVAPEHIAASDRVTVRKGTEATVVLQLKEPQKKVTTPTPTPTPIVAPTAKRRSKVSAWIALSMGGTALIAGSVYYALARDVANKAEGLDPNTSLYRTLEKRFDFRATMSYSLLGVGAIASGIGTYLLLRASKGPEQRAVGADVSTKRAVVWARWQF